jgi:hypothetical protein
MRRVGCSHGPLHRSGAGRHPRLADDRHRPIDRCLGLYRCGRRRAGGAGLSRGRLGLLRTGATAPARADNKNQRQLKQNSGNGKSPSVHEVLQVPRQAAPCLHQLRGFPTYNDLVCKSNPKAATAPVWRHPWRRSRRCLSPAVPPVAEHGMVLDSSSCTADASWGGIEADRE